MNPKKNIYSNIFVLVSLLTFLVLTFYFFKYPYLSLAIFLLYISLSLWVAIFLDFTTANLFVLLSFLVGATRLFFVPYETITTKFFLSIQLVILWAIWQAVKRFQNAQRKMKYEQERLLRELESNEKHAEQELTTYQLQSETLESKINRFQALSFAAKELGSLLDSAEIQKRLLVLLNFSFPKVSARIHPFQEEPLSRWISRRLTPVLVTDTERDLRFPEFSSSQGVRSIIAGPLLVEKKISSIVKIEGNEPYLFDSDDLRILDILLLVTSMALENAHLFSQVQELSITDTLTGLYTHKFFQERLNEEILRAGRYRNDIGLLLIDIDYFKKYNDTYGHQAGDEILRNLAKLIKHNLRQTDIIARYGGEEFGAILLQSGYQTTYEVAERIRRTVADNIVPGFEQTLRITVSIGVATFPQEATTASQLIRLADQRLYQAKSAGRNRVGGSVHSPS